MQDWKIETRRRLSGKLKDSTYKVFIDPAGIKYYSLAKAKQGGFTHSEQVDGRKTRKSRVKAADQQ